MVRTVLFDLDGTLLDSVPLILSAYRHVMALHLGHVPPDGPFLAGIGTPLITQLRGFGRDEDEVQGMLVDFRAYFTEHHDTGIRFFPGAADVVRSLHAAGVPLGLVTSKKQASSRRGLAMLGVLNCFSVLVCADDVQNPKPHGEPVFMALDALGADARSTVFVGDSTHDLASGRSAGVCTAAAMWGPNSRESLAPYEPTWWLDAPGDLLPLLHPSLGLSP